MTLPSSKEEILALGHIDPAFSAVSSFDCHLAVFVIFLEDPVKPTKHLYLKDVESLT
jgi:hypothetical protein